MLKKINLKELLQLSRRFCLAQYLAVSSKHKICLSKYLTYTWNICITFCSCMRSCNFEYASASVFSWSAQYLIYNICKDWLLCFGYGLAQLSLEVGRRGGPNRGKGILLDVLSKVEIDLLAEPLITQSFSLGRHGKCHRYGKWNLCNAIGNWIPVKKKSEQTQYMLCSGLMGIFFFLYGLQGILHTEQHVFLRTDSIWSKMFFVTTGRAKLSRSMHFSWVKLFLANISWKIIWHLPCPWWT